MLDKLWRCLAEPADGQTMAEYAVVITMITVGIVGAIALLNGGIIDSLSNAADLI